MATEVLNLDTHTCSSERSIEAMPLTTNPPDLELQKVVALATTLEEEEREHVEAWKA
ncbi:NADH-quinone oxidoreductase subunit NuoB [Sesbania bispinosa]|nr:NADH-quinone oxidoreductase subunit NuoB [Sesbania bispinosa]